MQNRKSRFRRTHKPASSRRRNSSSVVRMSRRTMQNVRRMSVTPNVSPHPTESGHLTVNRDTLDSLSITSLMSTLSNDEQPVGGLPGSPKPRFLPGLTPEQEHGFRA